MEEGVVFGPHLRTLRQAASMTLKQVADRAGLAVSTISKIENDRMSPTYDVLLKLARGLEVDLVTLMAGPARAASEGPAGRMDVTRASERRAYPTGTYVYEPFAMRLTNRLMDPTFVRVTARSIDEFPDLVRHPGEECVYILSGSVELHLEFYAPIRLEAGDSVYFDGRMGHAYISLSAVDAELLNICAGFREQDLHQLTNGALGRPQVRKAVERAEPDA
ncbi:XRE family transcriptional regulator [Mesorhizobium sp. CAU 1741]|uniref:helix-turn-helix domain-containing protein n=1 Tax=Mesorhizobium sp. CAU 1741 TaxID=3140366 RepID=UPI00325A8FEB